MLVSLSITGLLSLCGGLCALVALPSPRGRSIVATLSTLAVVLSCSSTSSRAAISDFSQRQRGERGGDPVRRPRVRRRQARKATAAARRQRGRALFAATRRARRRREALGGSPSATAGPFFLGFPFLSSRHAWLTGGSALSTNVRRVENFVPFQDSCESNGDRSCIKQPQLRHGFLSQRGVPGDDPRAA